MYSLTHGRCWIFQFAAKERVLLCSVCPVSSTLMAVDGEGWKKKAVQKEPSKKEGAKREPSSSIWQTDEGQAGFPVQTLCWVNQGRRKAVTENVGKWFLLHLIPKDSKVATLCCCDRFLFCLVSYKRSRWNFLLFSEIIVIHSEGKISEAFSFPISHWPNSFVTDTVLGRGLVYLHPSEGSVMHYHQKQKGLKKKAKFCLYSWDF